MDTRKSRQSVSVFRHTAVAGNIPQGKGKNALQDLSEKEQLNLEQAENSRTDKRREIPLHYRLLFSSAIMGLFIEWLLPLMGYVADPETVKLLSVLMLAAAALLLWGSLRLKGTLQLAVQCIIMFLAWFYMCAGNEGLGWFKAFIAGISGDAGLLLSGRLSGLSDDSRLLILVVGWGLLVSSVQQLALYRGSTALFTAVTIGYLLTLDIGLSIDTTGNLILSVGLILWLQALTGLLRLKEWAPAQELPYIRWGITALGITVLLTAGSWMAGQFIGARSTAALTFRPVFDSLEKWAERQIAEQPEVFGQAGTTGYESGDSVLGAPLTPGKEAVFKVTSREPAYWRGDSAAYYDGRRWIGEDTAFSPLNLASFPASAPAMEEMRTLISKVELAVPSSGGGPLFGAGVIVDITSARLTDGSLLGYVLANEERSSFRLPAGSGDVRVTGYTVKSLLPERNPAVLRTLKGGDSLPAADQYLQLPATLPPRVTALSKQITASADNRYDAVTAVRDYLQSHYSYTLNTRIPPSGSDFADDFLFVTKQGYCVHFATSMTVLLRSAGIPARYVKGYGPGTPEADSQPQRYLVTQGDAHAWVEVYFPGAGWVPFDPTPGAVPAAGDAAATAAAAASAVPQPVPSASHRADLLPALPLPGGPSAAPPAAVLLLAAAWRWRRSLVLLPAVRRAGCASREQQLRAAALAWRGLAARYGTPPPGVTAREYAASLAIEDVRLRSAVREFVRQWEALAYSGSPGAADLPGAGLVQQPSAAGAPAGPVQRSSAAGAPAGPVQRSSAAGVPAGSVQRSSAAGAPAGPVQRSSAAGVPAGSVQRSPAAGVPAGSVQQPSDVTASISFQQLSTLSASTGREAAAEEAAAFFGRCLLITFRLTI